LTYADRQMFEKLARLQRIATIAAGVQAAHPPMYEGEVINRAISLEEAIQRQDELIYKGL
jgi:hypothetical protein